MTHPAQQIVAEQRTERMIAVSISLDAPAVHQPPIVRFEVQRSQVVMSRIPEIVPGGGCPFTVYARPRNHQQGCAHNLAADRFGDATCTWCGLEVWSPFFVGMGVFSDGTLTYLLNTANNHEAALAAQNG